MRISIPSVPEQAARSTIQHSVEQGAKLVADFLSAANGRALIMTGAGVSVDSGIAPYRGENGRYLNQTFRPIFYHEFTDTTEKGHIARQRYFSRSYLGFPPVRRAEPNVSHYSIAALQRLGYLQNGLITQNVDNLHSAATPSASLAASTILELHGTLKHVVCVGEADRKSRRGADPSNPELFEALRSPLYQKGTGHVAPRPENTIAGEHYPHSCGFMGSRAGFQDELTRLNPAWAELAREIKETGKAPKMNPDGDVELSGVDYSTFRYPSCPGCGSALVKPTVCFFGETVPDKIRDNSFHMVDQSSALLLIGTSLATYSAFRLVKQAVEQKKPVLILNKGPTRADGIVPDKIELGSSEVLSRVAALLSNGRERNDKVLSRLLSSGVTIRPDEPNGVVSS